jgi:hypothetical protein
MEAGSSSETLGPIATLHSATSQKTMTWILTAVKTPALTIKNYLAIKERKAGIGL